MEENGNLPNSDHGNIDPEKEAERLIKEKEAAEASTKASEVVPEETPKVTSLGKATAFQGQEETKSVVEDIGWIRVKPETLPSQGMYYPTGTEITIRAAAVAEIRHWSTIDEEDLLALNDALNRIIDRCCKIRFPQGQGSYRDIREIDRFWIVFAIREFTFKKGENSLKASFKCTNCSNVDDREIIKEMLSYYTPDVALQARFDHDQRCFKMELRDTGEKFNLYLPTVGVMQYITTYIKAKSQSGEDYDKAFLRFAPFIFSDWRVLNDSIYTKTLQDSYAWSLDKISVLDWFVTSMEKSVSSSLKHECSTCGSEVAAQLTFPGGVKSLFLISDISSKLL